MVRTALGEVRPTPAFEFTAPTGGGAITVLNDPGVAVGESRVHPASRSSLRAAAAAAKSTSSTPRSATSLKTRSSAEGGGGGGEVVAATGSGGGRAKLAVIEFPAFRDFDGGLDPDEDKPKISCCYGLGVFVGLAIALLLLTGMVIYAGFWYNLQMSGTSTILYLSKPF